MNYINKKNDNGQINRKRSLSHLLYTTYIYGTIALFLAIIIGGAGCRKTFVTNPSNSITEADIKGEKSTQALLDGTYRYLRSLFSNGGHNTLGSAAIGLATDLMTADMGLSNNDYGWFSQFYDYTTPTSITSGWISNVWEFYYTLISNVNYVINQTSVPPAQKAQALAMRAYAYYNLINLFANWKKDSTTKVIPITLQVTIDPPPLASPKEIYDHIDQDLLESIKLFKEAQTFTKVNKSNIDSSVAHGLLARSYLFRGNLSAAKTQACLALGKTTQDGNDLMDTTEYKEGFNNIDNKEWMWGLPVNNAQLQYFASFTSHMDPTSPGYAGIAGPKFMEFTLYDSMCEKDVRKRVVTPIKGTGSGINSKVKLDSFDLVSLKFRDPNSSWKQAENYIKNRGKSKKVVPSWLAAYPLMRKAEMYLIIAECNHSNSGGTCSGGSTNCLISCLRKKRMGNSNNGCCNGQNCNKDTVYKERRRELWGEGFALYDLKRLDRPVNRDSTHRMSPASTYNKNVYYVSAKSDSLTFYIPQDVLNTNPNYGGAQPLHK